MRHYNKFTMLSVSPFLLILLMGCTAREMLFITLYGNHTIQRCELNGSNPVALVSGKPHVAWPDGVQVDVKRGKMYWSNMGTGDASKARAGSVYSSNLDGTKIQVIVPPGTIGSGKEMHLDVSRQQLYVADKQKETAGIWRIDLSNGPPFSVKPLLQKQQGSASGVTLDNTGEKVLITSDGEGNPSGIGVMAREIPTGMSAANRTDVVWHYTSENPIDVIGDSTGQVYWSDSGGISPYGIRVGSVDGTAPARTIRTKKELHTSFPVGVSLTKDEETIFYATFGMGAFLPNDTAGAIYSSSVHGGDKQRLIWTPGHSISVTGVSVVDLPDQFL